MFRLLSCVVIISLIQSGSGLIPHDLFHLVFVVGQIGRLFNMTTPPVIAALSFEMAAVGSLSISPIRSGLASDSTVHLFTFSVPHGNVYDERCKKIKQNNCNENPHQNDKTTN